MIRLTILLAIVFLLLCTGCAHSARDRCPLDYFTIRQRECPWCGLEMRVYSGNTSHKCKIWTNQ